MKDQLKIKCDGKNSNYCSMLESKIEGITNATKKGIILMVLINFKTARSRVVGVSYKSNAKDVGVMFNFCPFCGERIDQYFNNCG